MECAGSWARLTEFAVGRNREVGVNSRLDSASRDVLWCFSSDQVKGVVDRLCGNQGNNWSLHIG
jgi:hypothetical protein